MTELFVYLVDGLVYLTQNLPCSKTSSEALKVTVLLDHIALKAKGVNSLS